MRLTESGKDFYKYSLDILRLMEKLLDTKSTPEGFMVILIVD